MATVRFDQATRLYPGNDVPSVDKLDIDVADGEFLVLVGPSGCGKSTSLRMLAGLEPVNAGHIRIGERDVTDVDPAERDIAMVFQTYALYPHMTVAQNMGFALKLRKVPKPQIHARVTDAAKILDIVHLLDRKPKQLSGGQRQRVAVGRASVREPAAFLFDEPLSNLDAKLRVTTRAELKRLHQRLKTTTIYVTHDQEEAMTLGDRIVVMKDGRIQQADTPLNTYTRPVNRFVAGFVGMPPMNFFDGVLKSDGGQLIFEEGQATAGFRLPVPAHLRAHLSAHVGRHVALGIRPEHLHLTPAGGEADSAPVSVTVTVVEPLGKDMDVYVRTSLKDGVVARLEAQGGLTPESGLTLYADLRKVHFFDPGDTGANLSHFVTPTV
jgi:multiple sugar transport system ATP-binding protein